MYLQKIRLENFQAHKDTTLTLHPYYNTFVGVGNSGKSSIVRALSLVFYNTWETSWVRHGATSTRVTVITDAGLEIIREKGERINKYIVRVPGKAEQVYENFGTQVPTEVSSLLQIAKVPIDTNETIALNISQQLDPLFLLSKPGSTKAKVIGKLSGAHLLDYVLKDLNKDKKNLQAEKVAKAAEILDIQEQLKKYISLDERQHNLARVETQIASLDTLEKNQKALQDLHRRAQNWKKAYTTAMDEHDRYAGIVASDTGDLERQVSILQQLRTCSSKLLTLQQKVARLQTEYETQSNLFEQHKLTYLRLLQEEKKCPTCQAPVTDAALHAIQEGLWA